MQAIWKGRVLAKRDDTVVVDANHYFPAAPVNRAYFKSSDTTSRCPWEGKAGCCPIVVGSEQNTDAARCYPAPGDAARAIKDRIAICRGAAVVD